MYFVGNDPEGWYGDICYACGGTECWRGSRCSIILCDDCRRKYRISYFEELGWKIRVLREREKELKCCVDPTKFTELIDLARDLINDYADKDHKCMKDVCLYRDWIIENAQEKLEKI